jgi:hypothetical protein
MSDHLSFLTSTERKVRHYDLKSQYELELEVLNKGNGETESQD